ncbi:H/ACA ribonucleoprotein complex non-core subunit naf1 [Mactra antiquata]
MEQISENSHSVISGYIDLKTETGKDLSCFTEHATAVSVDNITEKNDLVTSIDSGIHDVIIKQEFVDCGYINSESKLGCNDHVNNTELDSEKDTSGLPKGTASENVIIDEAESMIKSDNEADNAKHEGMSVEKNSDITAIGKYKKENGDVNAKDIVDENVPKHIADNKCAKDILSDSTDQNVALDISEPVLMEYRSTVNSTNADVSSDFSPDSSDSDVDNKNVTSDVHETTETQINKIMSADREEMTVEQERKVKLNRHGFEDIRTKGELLPEDLPPLEELTITVDKSVVMVEVGNISSIVGILVVIKSKESVPPLNDETILFMEGHKVIGQVFEVFGPVKTPWYSVRFNDVDNITSKGLKVGMPVYYAPREESFTRLVFVDNLRNLKGSDASWEDNNEPPEKHLDYSDDEAERKAKAKKHYKPQNKDSDGDNDGNDNDADDNEGNSSFYKKRKQRHRGRKGRGSNNEEWNPFMGNSQAQNSYMGSNNGRSFQSWPSQNQPRFNRPHFNNPNNSMNHPRFGQFSPMGGLNQQQFIGQANMISGWADSKQNDGLLSTPRPGVRGPNTSSVFSGQNQNAQVNVDLTRPPPPFMKNSLRLQSFGQNQMQAQMNALQNNTNMNGLQVSNVNNSNVNQSMNIPGSSNNSKNVQNGPQQQHPVMIQSNSMTNYSNIRNPMMNNMSAATFNNNFPQILPMSPLCSQSMPVINVPGQTTMNNQAILPSAGIVGHNGMMGGSDVTNMAANMMTQQTVQNGHSFVCSMNETNSTRLNHPHGAASAFNQQTLNNQTCVNGSQMGIQNARNVAFMPHTFQNGMNPGLNFQGSVIDPRLVQNSTNL